MAFDMGTSAQVEQTKETPSGLATKTDFDFETSKPFQDWEGSVSHFGGPEEHLEPVKRGLFQQIRDRIVLGSTEERYQKGINVDSIVEASGFSRDEVEKHYDDFIKLAEVQSLPSVEYKPGLAKASVDILEKSMPAIIAGSFVANPLATAAGVWGFEALNKLGSLDQFAPEGSSEGFKSALKLADMAAKGWALHGVFDMLPVNQPSVFKFMKDVFKKTAQEKNIPGKVIIEPEQMQAINTVLTPEEKANFTKQAEIPANSAEISQNGVGISVPTENLVFIFKEPYADKIMEVLSPAEEAARFKRASKLEKKRSEIIDMIANSILKQEGVPAGTYAPELIVEAKRQALETINMKEYKDRFQGKPGKLLNREKRLRFELTQELNAIDTAAREATIKAEQARASQATAVSETPLETPAKAKEGAAKTQEIDPSEIGTGQKVDTTAGAGAKVVKERVPGAIEPIEGTGATKTAGLAKGVEARAIEEKLTSDFQDLPQYKAIDLKEQAELAADLIKKDYEAAKRIAMGEEPAPKGIVPESIFVGVENRAIAEGDVATLRDLATKSRLVSEATTMGQRIRTLGERVKESPVEAIQDIEKTREAAVKTRLKVKDLEKTKKSIADDIRKEIKKEKPTKSEWEKFIDDLEC